MNSIEYEIYMKEQVKKMKANLKKKKAAEITKKKKLEKKAKYEYAENHFAYMKYKNLLDGKETREMEEMTKFYKKKVEEYKAECKERGLI